MANRSEDWLRQASADLKLAETARDGGSFEWSCFAAQQSAEKAVKAVHYGEGASVRGHSVAGLLKAIGTEPAPGPDLLKLALELDRHYVPTRYPNGFPAGAPIDFFTKEDADRAIQNASAVLEWCRRRAR